MLSHHEAIIEHFYSMAELCSEDQYGDLIQGTKDFVYTKADPKKAAYWTMRAERAEKAKRAAYPPKPFNSLIGESI